MRKKHTVAFDKLRNQVNENVKFANERRIKSDEAIRALQLGFSAESIYKTSRSPVEFTTCVYVEPIHESWGYQPPPSRGMRTFLVVPRRDLSEFAEILRASLTLNEGELFLTFDNSKTFGTKGSKGSWFGVEFTEQIVDPKAEKKESYHRIEGIQFVDFTDPSGSVRSFKSDIWTVRASA